MGAQLITGEEIPAVPWLDDRTAGLLRTTVFLVAERHPDLRAAILFGSVARQDERPLTDEHPSDVDVLLLFDVKPGSSRISPGERRSIFTSIGVALDQYLDAPREVQIIPTVSTLIDWDPLFIENVARDGLLLWARGPLPEALAPVATRRLPAPTLR